MLAVAAAGILDGAAAGVGGLLVVDVAELLLASAPGVALPPVCAGGAYAAADLVHAADGPSGPSVACTAVAAASVVVLPASAVAVSC